MVVCSHNTLYFPPFARRYSEFINVVYLPAQYLFTRYFTERVMSPNPLDSIWRLGEKWWPRGATVGVSPNWQWRKAGTLRPEWKVQPDTVGGWRRSELDRNLVSRGEIRASQRLGELKAEQGTNALKTGALQRPQAAGLRRERTGAQPRKNVTHRPTYCGSAVLAER